MANRQKLGLAENADLQTLYDALLAAMTTSYAALTKMLKGEDSGGQKLKAADTIRKREVFERAEIAILERLLPLCFSPASLN